MNNSCCFTGHRSIPYSELTDLKIELDSTVRSLISKGFTDFYVGGARGFDTLAAECVLHLKSFFPEIKLYLILPCKNQTELWTDSDRQRYSFILSHADDVQCLYEEYNKRCMFERNRELVKSADVCVCYLKEPKGGTQYTVSLAAKRGLKIIPLGLKEDEKSNFENLLNSNQLSFEDIA